MSDEKTTVITGPILCARCGKDTITQRTVRLDCAAGSNVLRPYCDDCWDHRFESA